jgi:preprotein translocase subunit SecE
MRETPVAGRPRKARIDVTGFTPVTAKFEGRTVAKPSPGEYIRQVRAEGSKVVWPSRKETVTTAIMVMIMTAMLALFFFGIDAAFSAIVQFLLGLLG